MQKFSVIEFSADMKTNASFFKNLKNFLQFVSTEILLVLKSAAVQTFSTKLGHFKKTSLIIFK